MDCPKCKKPLPDQAAFCPWCGRSLKMDPKRKTRGNGQGTVWKNGRGNWTAQVTVGWFGDPPRRKYRTKSGFRTKKEALAALPALTGHDWTQPRDMRVSAIWAALETSWLPDLSKDRQSHMRLAYKRLEPLWGADITHLITADWQAVVDTLPDSRGPRKNAKDLISKLYAYAMAQGWIEVDMSKYIRIPQEKSKRREPFTHEELLKLWSRWEEAHDFTGYILIMCYTGMRPGELMDVKISDVHAAEGYMIGGIKTEAGRDRMLGFPAFLRPVIDWAVENGKRGKLCPVCRRSFYPKYTDALDAAGIERTEERKMTPHSCRHTFVTLGTEAGIPVLELQKMAGHSDPKMTAHYSHAHDPELLKAWQTLPAPRKK